MIELRETEIEDLAIISEFGSQDHSKPFLNVKSMADYESEFTEINTTYLCIINSSNIILGYFILVKSAQKKSIQLKRILISKESLGIGQRALAKLEEYCISIMGIKRIWLDVYDNNYRAIHVYKKLGYQLFTTEKENKRNVLYFDKSL
ncbi:GNAT family N-acetyltransferase [Moritella sp.]|uniref:GNAT family N-acetyltransferase n=1 Tax=Moritella sp. TaxID=78556 RepID=UPI00343F6C74